MARLNPYVKVLGARIYRPVKPLLDPLFSRVKPVHILILLLVVGLGGSFWPVVDGRLNLAPSAQEKAAWWPGSKETEEWVSRPDRLRAEILKWEKVLQDRPYDQGVLLQLAVLNWQVYEEQKALEYFARAKYLDPNNAEVRRLGESIFLF